MGAGVVIPFPVRSDLETRLGVDLSSIRLHTGPRAEVLAVSERARAFAYGSHIVFGRGEYSPHTSDGRAVLAHEVAHCVQQSSSAGAAGLQHCPSVGPRSIDLDVDWAAIGASAYDVGAEFVSDVAEAPGRIYEGAVETGRQVAEWGVDRLIALLDRVAPDVMAFLRSDPIELIKDRIFGALDSVLGGFLSRIRDEGLVAALRETFGGPVVAAVQIASDLAHGDCSSLFSAVGAVISFGQAVFSPAFQQLRDFAATAGAFFSDIWDRLGKPAWTAIRDFAGDVWDTISEVADAFWEATAEVREFFWGVWEEFKSLFNIAWDSGTGLVDWLKEQAIAAWETIKAELGPALVPLGILGGALLMLSPLAPIVAVVGSYLAIKSALLWVYDNWADIKTAVVESREYLATTVLPSVLSVTGQLAEAVDTAGAWLSAQISTAAGALRELAGALGMAPLLSTVSDYLSGLVTDASDLATWAGEALVQLAADVKRVLTEMYELTRPIHGLILAILVFPVYPFLLPVVAAGWAWQLAPDCIKEPVVDWALGLMISAVQALPEFSNFGEAWPRAKARILSTLVEVQALPMERKLAATNRVAKMMTLQDVEWIGNLCAGAIEMPDHFVSQMEEELIGMDLTQPLPFEPPAGAQAGPEGQIRRLISGGETELDLLARPTLTAGDIQVDRVANVNFSWEFVRALPISGDGEVEFGERTDNWASLDAIRSEMAVSPVEPATGTGTATTTPSEVAPVATGFGPTEPEPTSALTPEEAIEARLQALMDQPMSEDCPPREAATDAPAAAAVPETIPPELQIGPLTQGQRARYMLSQMRKGLSRWFHCNREWLLPSLFIAVVALIAVEILTGGAVTAALPPIMEILSAIMIGVAAVRAAAHVGEYVAKAVQGDTAGGARSLARGLAVAAIELVFALLFNIGSVIKALRGGLRNALREAAVATRALGRTTAKAVQTLGRTAIKGATTAARNIRRAAGAIVHQGKLILEGVGSGLGRGIRSLRDLASRLWRRVRFRRFKIRRAGTHIQLWGYINPWVLMADGGVEEVTFRGTGHRPMLGMATDVAGRRRAGILIGVRDGEEMNGFLRLLDELDDAGRRRLFRDLEGMSGEARRAAISGVSQTAENARLLRTSMTSGGIRAGRGAPRRGHAAHHIVPSTHPYSGAEEARRILARCGIGDINQTLNGVFVPPKIHARLHTHVYMDAVADALRPILAVPGTAARRAQAATVLDDIARRILAGNFP